MNKRRLLRMLGIVCVLVVLPVTPAKACSCAYGDPRDMFAGADGAFVGTFVESHPVEPNPTNSGADTIYTFTLDEEYKGELGEPGDLVEVHAPYSGASCGIEAQEGQTYGLFLYLRDDGAWSSGLCSQVSPEMMQEAASPLPAPTSEGPVRMVAGGTFGNTQTMMLDARGRTVAYGDGDLEVTHLAGCRGGERILEVGRLYPDPPRLFVRDVASTEIVRSMGLPFGRKQRFRALSVAGLHCRSSNGRRAVVFATNYGEPEAKSVLLKVTGRDKEVIHQGTGRSATFGGGRVYMQQGSWGRDLTRVSLRRGGERTITKLPGTFSSELALSPDGSTLAAVAYPPYMDMETKPSKLYTVDLSGSRATIRTRSLGTGERDAHTAWLSNKRLVMFVSYPDSSRVFSLRLRAVARFGRWEPQHAVILGRRAYGVDWAGRLMRVVLPDGDVTRVRRLPSPVVFDLGEVR